MLVRIRKYTAVFIIAAVIPLIAKAQEGSKDIFYDPGFKWSGDISLVSNYLLRGQTLSQNKPTLQGGINYSFSSGIFFGNYLYLNASDVPAELDLIAGYSLESDYGLEITPLLTGFLYPANWNDNSLEATIDVTFKILGAQYNWDFVEKQHYMAVGLYFGVGKFKFSARQGILNKEAERDKILYDTRFIAEYPISKKLELVAWYVTHSADGDNFMGGLVWNF